MVVQPELIAGSAGRRQQGDRPLLERAQRSKKSRSRGRSAGKQSKAGYTVRAG
jgi:hypothetical protein